MAQSTVLTGAQCKLYISGNVYPADAIQYSIDYGESEIYGIDSVFPQEIATTRISVQGNVSGFRIQLSGGLQGKDIRSKINQVLHAPYLTMRIEDRKNKVDILFVQEMKVTSESVSIPSKGVVKLTFAFKGTVPFNVLDRA